MPSKARPATADVVDSTPVPSDGQSSQSVPRYPKFQPFGQSADGVFTGMLFESPIYLDAGATATVLASTALSRVYLLHDIANFIATSQSASEFEAHETIQLILPLVEDVKTFVEALQQRVEVEAREGGGHAE